jgi:disulfide oxidoreductase YuzD
MLFISVCVSFPTAEKTVQFERNLVRRLYRWSPFQRHNFEIFTNINKKTKDLLMFDMRLVLSLGPYSDVRGTILDPTVI